MRKLVKGTPGPIRLLTYSHDGFGLGHYRRHLKLATFLRREVPEISVMMITGSSMSHAFRIPPGVDYVKLPCVTKKRNDVYVSKYLPLSFKEIIAIRKRIVLETALAYLPHVFLVDKHPLGMGGEVLPALKALKESHGDTKVVLGIRDILDDPQVMVPYFRNPAVADVLENIYDEVWVYGCKSVYDPINEYQFTEAVAKKTKFCGYLSTNTPSLYSDDVRRKLGINGSKFVLVTAGGGGDGFPLMDTYLKALDFLPKAMDIYSLLVSGPDMPPRQREDLGRRCNGYPLPPLCRVELMEFSPRLVEIMSAADVVVSMGGYNTLLEATSLGKKAVVVPRITPRREQLLRAEAFEQRGLIRMVHPNQLSPRALAEAILDSSQYQTEPLGQHLEASGIDLNGLEVVKNNLLSLL